MPKIEVNEKLFFQLVGKRYGRDELEERLTVAKAELDEWDESSGSPESRVIKIELNDTNRPDLWSTGGVARALRTYAQEKIPSYPFFSRKGLVIDHGKREVLVDAGLKGIRPYIAAFVISGKPIDEEMLKDIIQTQEKLCWNYGRKRKSIAMGVYRTELMKFPVHYDAANPDTTSFVPLGMDNKLNLKQILKEHPKGQEFGSILEGLKAYPYLTDASGECLSFPPIINSARIGAVQVGDSGLFVEMTGTDMPSLAVTAAIVACDFADAGYEILPVKVIYPYDTPLGREVVFPYYFQAPVAAELSRAKRFLGEEIGAEEAIRSLKKMGVSAKASAAVPGGATASVTVEPPEYRNDFLHAADVVEDIMIGRGINSFKPERPRDFTIGRLHANELVSRKAKDIMVGLGYQEMIYNYLGSGRDYIEKMCIDGKRTIRIQNPMSENYEYVRDSQIPSFLQSEAVSKNAVYPHKVFETGKIAYLDPSENYGTKTRTSLGFLVADKDANFNQAASDVAALMYYMGFPYEGEDADDPRFIKGRQVRITRAGKPIGVFGEIHPQVLENWGIATPCIAGEIDLEFLIE